MAFSAAYLFAGVFLIFLGTSLDKRYHPGRRPEVFVSKVAAGQVNDKGVVVDQAATGHDLAVQDDLTSNHIILQVDDLGDLTLAPQIGDLIEWQEVDWSASPETVSHLNVEFTGDSPCDSDPRYNPPNGFCIVNSKVKNATFPYNCNTNIPHDPMPIDCVDPALGPRSASTPIQQFPINDFAEFVADIQNLSIALAESLGLAKPLAAQQTSQPQLHVGGPRVGSPMARPGGAVSAVDISVERAQVGCSNGVVQVIPPNQQSSIDHTIHAVPGEVINWSSTGGQLTFGDAANPNIISFGGPTCTVSKSKHTKNTWTCIVPPARSRTVTSTVLLTRTVQPPKPRPRI
jgi:hypothetical protein